MEAAMGEQASGVGDHLAARAAIDDAIARRHGFVAQAGRDRAQQVREQPGSIGGMDQRQPCGARAETREGSATSTGRQRESARLVSGRSMSEPPAVACGP